MTETPKIDPLEGFHVTDYDGNSKEVTIEIHRLVVKHSADALAKKLVEIIEFGPNVESVQIAIRPNT